MQSEVNIKELEKREEVTHAYADHSNFDAIFNPKEHINLETGLLEMAEWVKIHGIRSSKEFENIEITKRLPASWKKQSK